MTEPGFPLRTGFFGSLIYWVAVYFLEILRPAEGAALVTTIFILHALASDLVGRPLDYTYPLARIGHAVTNVPMPGLQRAKRPAVAASKKAK